MSARLWIKMGVAGAVMCIGGPALVWYITPTEEELIKRYNPELRKRALENREQKQDDFNQFVNQLKEYSRSDRPIWEVAAEAQVKRREAAIAQQEVEAQEALRRQEQIRQESLR